VIKHVGRILYNSLKILGWGFGASEMEAKVKFRALSRICHHDKHNPQVTGISTHKQYTIASAGGYFNLSIWENVFFIVLLIY